MQRWLVGIAGLLLLSGCAVPASQANDGDAQNAPDSSISAGDPLASARAGALREVEVSRNKLEVQEAEERSAALESLPPLPGGVQYPAPAHYPYLDEMTAEAHGAQILDEINVVAAMVVEEGGFAAEMAAY